MMIHLESVQEAVDREAPMFLLTKQNVKFLGLRTFLLLLFLCTYISPVSCEFRDFEDAVDGVHAINEPRDRHGGLSLGPLAVAGPPGRGRGPEDDEKDDGGHL